MIRGKYLTSKDDIAPVLAVRNAVFVEEQGFSAEGERDAYDDMAIYALAFNEEGAPVSTGRLFVDRDGQFTIGRVCTLRAYRGQGYGDLIMRMLLYRAQELHAPGIYIHSRIFTSITASSPPAKSNTTRAWSTSCSMPRRRISAWRAPAPSARTHPQRRNKRRVHRPAARDFPREAR